MTALGKCFHTATGRCIAAVTLLGLGSTLLCGCIGKRPANPAATQPVTEVDPQLAEPAYWLAQPGTAEVTADDFTPLWDICEEVCRSYLLKIDRRDYRAGLLTTVPTVSKQFFELWRKDAPKVRDVEESSLATIRRTIYFQFSQDLDGTYTVVPKVLVERQAKPEDKYRDMGKLPPVYWYALRRDKVMEAKLADAIRSRLQARAGT